MNKPQNGRHTGRPGTTGTAKDSMPKTTPAFADEPRNQYGALCWRAGKSGAEVLLISSRETGRWVIPKGWPMEGRSAAEAAEKEAWEEAGVKGQIAEAKLGHFTYDKTLRRDTKHEWKLPCIVDVFPLQVTKLAPEYPEQRQRRRKWFAVDKAARKVAEAELKALLTAFNPTLPENATANDTPPTKGRKR
jgi:8-oxo-dGTP pyrophosphatase MutT (NUDIX family)